MKLPSVTSLIVKSKKMKPVNHPIVESSNYLESTFGQSFELK